jgi:hypothetical protein
MSMMRIPSGDLAEKPVKAMNTGSARQKHERTLSRNHLHTLLLAECNRFSADCPFSSGPVHPDFSYACLSTVAYHRLGDCGRGHQQHSFDGRLHVLYASKASSPLYLCRIWIYGNHVIPAATQFFEQFHAEICRIP